MRTSLLLVSGALLSCSGGGGSSSGSFKSTATLLAVTFPDPNDVNLETPDSAPQNAPLVQPVVFTFSAAPDPSRINATVLPILDEASNLPVPGRYVIEGAVVTFVPELPTRPVGTTANGSVDDGGAGLEVNRAYTVRVGPKTFSFVANVDAALRVRYPDPLDPKGLFVKFRTMPALTADSFRALEVKAPQLVAADPVDGSTGISPRLFTDPDALFAAPRAFQLLFDAPINPDSTVVNDTVFELIDLDDRPLLFPNGRPLGIEVALVENRVDRAVVEITPSGILPFGHLLALQYDAELKGLSETGTPAGGPLLATTFTTAVDPGGALHDSIVETFDTNDREETDLAQIGNGNLPADWNRDRSGILQAALEFDGTGVIGRFVPTAPGSGGTNTIVLDTTSQSFPLPDGSTPDAPPGLVVTGGVFHFTDVDVPSGVVIKAAGGNPLILKCTGSFRLAGDLEIAGENGSSEYSYDSAITAIPGGPATAGGGRGGEAHPVTFYPATTINYLTLVSPQFSATGFGIDPVDGVMKRLGGTGAQSGILDQKDSKGKYQTNFEWASCDEFRDGNGTCKIAGGGGGSLLRAGETPRDNNGKALNGICNVVPDGTGKWICTFDNWSTLCGVGGPHPFADDGTTSNDYYGKLGQLKRLIGGQGGGGGGTLCDSYYCGVWCDQDSDSTNDGICANGDFLPQAGRSPSVGDSRGGGGGGGGGVLLVQALGDITIEAGGSVVANGGNGGGGEGIACSYWGGGGGGGAGGMIVLQSASTVTVKQNGFLDVRRGVGDLASPDNDYFDCGDSGSGAVGDGGNGGHGLIQLQVPAGSTASVPNPGTTDTNGSIRPPGSWIDPTNTLAPVEFTPVSVALSTWYDFGRVIARGGGLPALSFSGLDGSGFVVTDGAGNVLSPATTDILCGYLGQVDPVSKTYLPGEEPRANFIPSNAKVKVEFQGADAIVDGSKEVDPATLTAWSPAVTIASGRQFVRWRVTFDTTADGSSLTPSTRRPIVERVEIHADF